MSRTTLRVLPACLLLATAIGRTQETKTEQFPSVRPVSGAILLWRAGKENPEPLSGAAEVRAADRLGTANGEPASFLTEQDALVTLRGVVVRKNKGLGLLREAGGLVLKLFDGSVLVDSVETRLAIETPFGKIEGKPAMYLVEVTKKDARVVALSGTVTFTNSLGTATLKEGEASAASAGEKPQEPRPHGPVHEDLGEGGNLFKNPGFENDLAEWTDDTGKSEKAMVDSKVSYAGKKSVRFDIRGEVERGRYLAFKQNPPLVVGERYLIRCFIRAESKRGLRGTFLEVQRGSRDGDACYRDATGKWSLHRIIFTARISQPHPLIGLQGDGDLEATVWADEYFLSRLPK
jgi:hypothetical protein